MGGTHQSTEGALMENAPALRQEIKEIVLDVWYKISRWMCGDY